MLGAIRTLKSRSAALELIDGHIESREELAQSFADIALANRRFGGTAAARYALSKADARSVLDVGAGSGDIARTLRDEYLRAGRDVTFTCLDANAELVGIARGRSAGEPGFSCVEGDALNLPFADGAFDVAMCNLTLHHFEPSSAVQLLRELRRVSRRTPLVTDLRRCAAAWLAAFAFSRLFTRNRLTRHDAPLSARRAYTPGEAIELAKAAGWERPAAETFGIIRLVLSDAASI